MTLSFGQVLWLVLTIAGVVVLIVLAMLLLQLRKTAREAELALAKGNELMEGFKEIERKINAGVDDAAEVLCHAKAVASNVSKITFLVSTQVVRPALRLGPVVIPLVQFGLRMLRKRKKER